MHRVFNSQTRRLVSVESEQERFWKKVHKTDGCWVWTGNADARGYGLFRGCAPLFKTIRAHRFSYELHCGEIPVGILVCHHCDTPGCVRPDHLFLGTPGQNSLDMVRKHRSALRRSAPKTPAAGDDNGTRRYPERRPRGDRHGTRTSPDLVRAVRAAYAVGDVTYAELGRRFGKTSQSIGLMVRRITFKHIE